MNETLRKWNEANELAALEPMLACCAAQRWATAMVAARPLPSEAKLTETADVLWSTMHESDWMQAFAAHPRIGERTASRASERSLAWSSGEQSTARSAPDWISVELAERNAEYEERYGFTYIVCATGKRADELLAILHRRLHSDRPTELREAAEQQRQIMQIRLRKWLAA